MKETATPRTIGQLYEQLAWCAYRLNLGGLTRSTHLGPPSGVACCLVFTFLYGALRQVFSLPPPGVSVRAPWEV